MANQKNADPALVQKKLAVLNPQLKALEEQRAACEDPRKQKTLEKRSRRYTTRSVRPRPVSVSAARPSGILWLTPSSRPTLSGLPFSPWGL